MLSKLKIRFLSIFSIILLCISLTTKALQNDTFYIIKVGGDILKNGVDLVDHYSWIANLSYTYPHWLYDVIWNYIYSNFDYLGIYISSMILFIFLVFTIYIINLKINRNELMATIISFVSIPCLVGFITARAQLITIILFLWQVYFIEKLINSGKKKYIIYLSLISLLVANLHATIWPFYFILYLPFISQFLIRRLLYFFKNNRILFANKLEINSFNNFKLLIFGMFLGFLMGFISPSKICFTYVFKIMQGSSQNYIIEHAPMVLIKNFSFLIYIVIILVILIFSKTKIKLYELFMISGLVFMSLCSSRHVVFFYVIGLLYLSILCNRYLLDNKDNTLDILTTMLVNNKIIYLLSFVIVLILSFYKFNENFSFDYVPTDQYPVEAVEFIKKNLDINDMRLYNEYNFGSYLLFNDIPVFIDSRSDLYLKEFNGLDYSIFDDAMNMAYNYEEKFEFYGVTHALIFKDNLFYSILIKDQNYELIYNDSDFALFEKV